MLAIRWNYLRRHDRHTWVTGRINAWLKANGRQRTLRNRDRPKFPFRPVVTKANYRTLLKAVENLLHALVPFEQLAREGSPVLPQGWCSGMREEQVHLAALEDLYAKAEAQLAILTKPTTPKAPQGRRTVDKEIVHVVARILRLYEVAFGAPPSLSEGGPTTRFLSAFFNEVSGNWCSHQRGQSDFKVPRIGEESFPTLITAATRSEFSGGKPLLPPDHPDVQDSPGIFGEASYRRAK
jgi:hypothetical protein